MYGLSKSVEETLLEKLGKRSLEQERQEVERQKT
jgi:hypothetical protein